MSKSEYTTVANLPLSQIGNPAMRALVAQFAAQCKAQRFGAILMANVRRVSQ